MAVQVNDIVDILFNYWIKDSRIIYNYVNSIRLVRNDGYLHGYSTYHRCILVLFVH